MTGLPEGAIDPEFRMVYEYWQSRTPGRLPSRSDIDPFSLPARLIPWFMLVDVVPGERRRYRFRLIGTGIVDLFQGDYTGAFIDDVVAPSVSNDLFSALDRAVETRTPQFVEGPVRVPKREFVMTRRLGLPLASDGHNVDMVWALFVPKKS